MRRFVESNDQQLVNFEEYISGRFATNVYSSKRKTGHAKIAQQTNRRAENVRHTSGQITMEHFCGKTTMDERYIIC